MVLSMQVPVVKAMDGVYSNGPVCCTAVHNVGEGSRVALGQLHCGTCMLRVTSGIMLGNVYLRSC